ncbi:MAG: DUF2892 domain-containing protein [Alphaproteobacteria bacterium]
MQCNIGKKDKILRLVLGLALVIWGMVSQNWLGAIGLVLIITAMVRFCPAYTVIGMNTDKK